MTDTVKRIDRTGTIETTLDRTSIRLVQTPQAFAFPALLKAHRHAAEQGRDDFTDDAALAEWVGMKVSVFEGEPGNIKLTTPDDFARAEAIQSASLGDVRTGSGFDVHAFGPGDHVTLGGIRIPCDKALTGHSDADVALHALTDAILGALADGDIGAHFPPTDPQWRGASSDRFLVFAVDRVRARGGLIAHLDLTIVCEFPRISAHRDTMRANIARLARIDTERVAVKATTSEKLGFTGRGEGIVAYANGNGPPPVGQMMSDKELLVAAETLLELCKSKKLTLATAESCTGGLVAATISEIPGSSLVLDRGFVTYSNEAKQQMLGVTPATIDVYGAVSTECAEEMAKGALAHASVDLAVSITGIAGPTGAVRGKPIGLVYFCAASRSGRVIAHDRKYGDIGRANVRRESVLQALAMLQELAEKEEPRPPAGQS